MAWKKNSEEMVALVERSLATHDCQRKPMFGCPAFFVNDNMFAGLHQDVPILRLSPEDREAFLSTFDEATLFEPMAGRPMREYVAVPEAVYNDAENYGQWLERAFEYAMSLPPKAPKAKKKPSR